MLGDERFYQAPQFDIVAALTVEERSALLRWHLHCAAKQGLSPFQVDRDGLIAHSANP